MLRGLAYARVLLPCFTAEIMPHLVAAVAGPTSHICDLQRRLLRLAVCGGQGSSTRPGHGQRDRVQVGLDQVGLVQVGLFQVGLAQVGLVIRVLEVKLK